MPPLHQCPTEARRFGRRSRRARRRPAVLFAVTTSLALTLSACAGQPLTSADTVAAQGDSRGAQLPADAPASQDTTIDAAPGAPGAGDVGAANAAPVSGQLPAKAGIGGETSDGQKTSGAAVVAGKASVGKAHGGGKASGGQKTGTGSAVVAGSSLVDRAARTVATQQIFGGTTPCQPATLSEIPIGNVSTLSGVLGELFSPIRLGLDTFVAAQNACGGLNGHRIKLYVDDDQGDPSTAISKVTNMIQNNKVMAFVGNIEVLTVDAIVPTIKKYGIPVIGSDVTNNTEFTNPLMFPQGSNVQSTAYGFIQATTEYFKKTKIGNVYCLEVPRACEQAARALKELAPKFGAQVVKSMQTSITSVSYVQQCLDMKSAGVEVVAMNMDAASEIRMGRSCEQVGFHPDITAYPIGVGNERQFLQGTKWLGNTYIPLNTFPWMASDTPAERYFQAALKRYSPGQANGAAASLGWTSGALLVAASAGLSETNPTTQQLLDTLYTFKGQKFTELGGLAGPRTFSPDGKQKVPYCLFNVISNDANTGWRSALSKAACTGAVAPSDPQSQF